MGVDRTRMANIGLVTTTAISLVLIGMIVAINLSAHASNSDLNLGPVTQKTASEIALTVGDMGYGWQTQMDLLSVDPTTNATSSVQTEFVNETSAALKLNILVYSSIDMAQENFNLSLSNLVHHYGLKWVEVGQKAVQYVKSSTETVLTYIQGNVIIELTGWNIAEADLLFFAEKQADKIV